MSNRSIATTRLIATITIAAAACTAANAGDLTDAGDLSIPVNPVVTPSKVMLMTPTAQVVTPAAFFDAISQLLHEYYPSDIKIKKTAMTYRAEYKSRMYDVAQTNTVEPGPKWGGIWINMELKPGPYKGVESVPQLLNQYDGPYRVLILAPTTAKEDCHMSVRIAYPNDVNPDFLTRFRNLVADFERYLKV